MKKLPALACLLLCVCSLPQSELLHSEQPTEFTTCELALATARSGDSCRDLMMCTRSLSDCCFEQLSCVNGLIAITEAICRDCACTDDVNCSSGSWCIDGRCRVCPQPTSCAGCPLPLVSLSRNGCATCDCGPSSGCSCLGSASCQSGAYCLAGCAGRDCCLRFCSEPGCTTPNPEGCATTCSESCAERCIATSCQCAGGKWSCIPRCGKGLQSLISRCETP